MEVCVDGEWHTAQQIAWRGPEPNLGNWITKLRGELPVKEGRQYELFDPDSPFWVAGETATCTNIVGNVFTFQCTRGAVSARA